VATWARPPGRLLLPDGGARWRRLFLGGSVDTVAAGTGTVYAVVSPPGGKAPEQDRQ